VRSATAFANKNKWNQIPVISNLYPTFTKCKDLDPGELKLQQNIEHTKQNKDEGSKLKHKILIIGDSHTRCLVMNLRHNLNEEHKEQGLVKPDPI
jgi:hypothetical protein